MARVIKWASLQVGYLHLAAVRLSRNEEIAIEVLVTIGQKLGDLGRFDEAARVFHQAKLEAARNGSAVLGARSDVHLASVAILRKDYRDAERFLEAAIPILRDHPDRTLITDALLRLALVCDELGRIGDAKKWL